MKVFVHVPSQTLDLIGDDGRLVGRFACSTSRFGVGFEEGSFKTPTGRFRVVEKFGDGEPEGMVFVSRVATGRIGRRGEGGDEVRTRILWLEGLDAENANTRGRYIYIHGTNAEDALGTPASHGCVRLSDADVVRVFDAVPVGAEVVISEE